MMGSSSLLLLFLLCVINVHSQLTPDVQALVNLMESMRDKTADPCTDFYQYACGAFVASHPVPSNVTGPYLSVPAIDAIGYNNDRLLAQVVQDPWPIVNDLYQSCMQPDSAMQSEFQSFFLQKIKEITSIYEVKEDLWDVIAYVANQGAYSFIFPQVSVGDDQIPNIYLTTFGNTYTASDYQNETLYNELLNEIIQVFELFENSTDAKQDALAVIELEEMIAQNSNSNNSYQTYTVQTLSAATQYDFLSFLSSMGIVANLQTEVYADLAYLQNLTSLEGAYPPWTLQQFFVWKIYSTYSAWYLPECYNNNNPSSVCQSIMGNSPYSPPWDQASFCRNFVHYMVQDMVGLIFDYEVVTSDVSSSIKNMTTGIQQAFNKSLSSLNWLDDYSLESVQFKLDHVIQIIGHPNVMDRYENVTTTPDQYFSNLWNILGSTIPYGLKLLTVPFNRSDFEFDPMIINAFYDPSTNTINFPAGMLEGPMFSGSWPKLFQYSRFGVVVGHENTHGFDNQGSLWNAYGLPGDILDNSTRTNFQNSAVCIANFYSQYVVYGNTTIPGNNTLGENIADIGGVKNSFRAYQAFVAENGEEFKDYQLMSDLTTDQVYFLHYGQTWCSSSNQAWLEYQLQNDVHSPAKFRVNGPLTQFDEFAAAFNCPANTPMNPPSRCDLW